MWTASTFRVAPEAIPTFQLAPSEGAGTEGFRIWDLRYNKGYHVHPNGTRVPISFVHRHPHFEIFWVRSGRAILAWDCERVSVGAGSLLVVAPGEVHSWSQTDQLEGAALSVAEAFTSNANFTLPFSRLASHLEPRASRNIKLLPADQFLVRSFFESLLAPEDSCQFHRPEVAKALLVILFSRFNAGREPSRHEWERAASPVAFRFQTALLTECPRLVSVKEFAQLLGVSRSHLHREVLESTGRSPSELIRERIVMEAKRLLTHTQSPHTEIARLLGFRSASYFGAYFRAHTNLSPAEYRLKRSA